MNSGQIRQQFLDFFKAKGHTIVESAPVVPLDDPTLMFTNAGMNQFKDVFLGTGSRPYRRAADTQKCIRAGGKHNDLDDVGRDTYHHTFFEMLGNWSFGDYFKKEAIEWAWELLTGVWGIEKERLFATYFEGDSAEGLEPDNEAADLWKSVTDIDPSHVLPGNKKDNFWEMGDTGPCGPCSEIHIDLTPDKSGAALVNAGDPRVIELWNLVFIQYNRAGGGALSPLPARHVDTGMGFERLCAVLTGMKAGKLGGITNYDTDVFAPIFDAIRKQTAAPAYAGTLPGEEATKLRATEKGARRSDEATEEERDQGNKGTRERGIEGSRGKATKLRATEKGARRSDGATEGERDEATEGVGSAVRTNADQVMIDVSYRVIADHLRCLTFALTDGAVPSNEGRGYVLRRILRRAVRYGRQYLDMHKPFLYKLVAPLVDHMAGAFPELRYSPTHKDRNVAYVTDLIRDEEASFLRTLDRGIRLFNDVVLLTKAFSGNADAIMKVRRKDPYWDHPGERQVFRDAGEDVIPGEALFRLYDTYGFPVDLSELMAAELGIQVDVARFRQIMQEARKKARGVAKDESTISVVKGDVGMTQVDLKYWSDHCAARIRGYVVGDTFFTSGGIPPAIELALVTDRTCFYAEQGGQIGDTGRVTVDGADAFVVSRTKRFRDAVLHVGMLASDDIKLAVGDRVWLEIDDRIPIKKNHTATHLLNWALREMLGDHVQQKGSLVDPEKTRFDFSHNRPLSNDELARIESLVNERIAAGLPVYTQEVDQQRARQINTLRAVFGEKYPDKVRVVSIGVEIGDEESNEPNTLLGNPDNPEWMNYSVEFCGGTHLKNTREAECFALISEEGVAKGVRRVVGISGEAAKQAVATGEALLAEVKALADKPVGRALPDAGTKDTPDLAAAVTAFQKKLAESVIPIRARHTIQDHLAALQKTLKQQQKESATTSGRAVKEAVATLLKNAKTIGGVTVVVGEVPSAGADALRSAVDWIRHKTAASAVLLVTSTDNKVTLVAGMSKDAVSKGLKAGDLIKEIAPLVGGRGGGRPDMAQGGGGDPAGIAAALERAGSWITERLS